MARDQDRPASTIRTMGDLPSVGESVGLLLVLGAGQVFTHRVGQVQQIVIGRSPECDLVLDHPKLSRRHAVVSLGPPMTVQDLGSTNGTRVARETLKGGDPAPLGVGESFHIGPFSFVLLRGKHGSDTNHGLDEGAITVSDPTPGGIGPLVTEIARSSTSVLILGETGTGKERLADTLHALSGRKGPLLRLNCAAITDTLLESELFGHEKGAFTGADRLKPGLLESAHGGSVMLDELGEMAASAQAKLLRAIETREVMRVGGVKPVPIDVRFISATNRDLPSEIAAGRFRADLYYRLDGVSLFLPPLRERRGLIVPLAMQFLEAARKERGQAGPPRLGSDVLQLLQTYEWPGNVRELKAAIERAVLLASGGELKAQHLALRNAPSPSTPPPIAPTPATPPGDVAALLSPAEQEERARIVAALEECAGNQTRAATKLGISRATLVNKLALLRIPRPRKK